MGDRHLQLLPVQIHLGFLDSVHTPQSDEVDVGQRLSGDDLVRRSQSCFHDAAGRTEDDSSSCRLAQRMIEFLGGKRGKLDAGLLKHPGKFPGCQHVVDIIERIISGPRALFLPMLECAHHLGPACFVLLRRAGHHRNDHHFARIDVQFGGIVRFCQGTEHLLW